MRETPIRLLNIWAKYPSLSLQKSAMDEIVHLSIYCWLSCIMSRSMEKLFSDLLDSFHRYRMRSPSGKILHQQLLYRGEFALENPFPGHYHRTTVKETPL